MAEEFADEVAYQVVDGGALTFAEWDRHANALARGLREWGLGTGERVAIHVEPANALRWLIAYPAVHRAGGVAVPLNPRLADDEVARMLAHCEARAVVADGPRVHADAAAGAGGDGPVRLVVDATPGTCGPGGGEPAEPAEPADPAVPADPAGAPVLSWEEALAPDESSFQVPREGDDLADILYTSGTTGRPKGVAIRFSNASMVQGTRPSWNGGRWLTASPMFTFAGMAFVYNPMKLGMGAIYQPRFDAGRWLTVVEEERPVAVFLVPAMAQLLLDHERFEEADLSSIAICSVGSAPLSPLVLERLQERMPDATVSNNYGMTEAGSAYCIMPKGEAVKRPGSVGIPAPPARVRVVDSEGHEIPAGQVGEVRLEMPGRPREYFNDPEATAATWVDGWIRTGDLGRVDEDGYLYIVGRTKDVIIRGGNNVHAADVEHAITSHPDVLHAAVVGAPHPVLGEDVVAFVVPRHGREPSPDELRTHCLGLLADYKVPRQWHLVEDLPRNATGKVIKPELRRRLEEAS